MELKYVKRGEIAIYSPRPLVISKMCGHHQKLGYREIPIDYLPTLPA
jgi:hypothetical protein